MNLMQRSSEGRADIIEGILSIHALEFVFEFLTNNEFATHWLKLGIGQPVANKVPALFVNKFHPACSMAFEFDLGLEGLFIKSMQN